MVFGKRLLIFILIIALLALLSVFWPYITGKSINESLSFKKESAHVDRVIDGDTIVVTGPDIGNQTHIRLLGMNTPEHGQALASEAADFLKSKIEGKTITLMSDYSDKDQYGRKLRYVFLDDDLVNVDLVEAGFAPTLMTKGLIYEEKFNTAEKDARNLGIGLWKKSTDKCSNCIKLANLDYIKEYFDIKNICNFDCDLSGWFVKDDANHFFYLDKLASRETRRYLSSSSFTALDKHVKTEVWNDDTDRFFMRDKNGGLVIFYQYTNPNYVAKN